MTHFIRSVSTVPNPSYKIGISALLLFLVFSFLVPKPLLGNALAGEAPRLPVTGDGPKPGLRAQMRSQAGAWERDKRTDTKRLGKSFYCILPTGIICTSVKRQKLKTDASRFLRRNSRNAVPGTRTTIPKSVPQPDSASFLPVFFFLPIEIKTFRRPAHSAG